MREDLTGANRLCLIGLCAQDQAAREASLYGKGEEGLDKHTPATHPLHLAALLVIEVVIK